MSYDYEGELRRVDRDMKLLANSLAREAQKRIAEPPLPPSSPTGAAEAYGQLMRILSDSLTEMFAAMARGFNRG